MTQAIGLGLVVAGVVLVYAAVKNASPSQLVSDAFSGRPVSTSTSTSTSGGKFVGAVIPVPGKTSPGQPFPR